MAPKFEKSLKNEERKSKENRNNISNNNNSDEFNSSLEALQKEFQNAFNLSHLMNDLATMKSNEYDNLLVKSKNNTEIEIIQGEILKQEAKKGELKEVMKKTKVEHVGKKIDLELRLSPPKVIITKGESSSNGSKSPSESNESSDSDGGSNVNGKRLPSLILMGCTYCYLYVMVSEDDPECPKCKRFSNLLDIFRGNPSKKARKN
ncbi:uncharacterized protein LOC132805043 [Ziziphus jujuba]|uniref:Uncharacterized protein LOC132805043 n=1 Tax=Ziziphus jujuba TaxID=326968 RepID=A0ABM4AGC7_ZIZJJ|nr:uncharacterized protein LOC132805043 [Ziziphus jujuba]